MIPGIFVGKWLVSGMFAIGKPCTWERFGAKCATCGGTHCVQSFLRGDFVDAFYWNPMVFCWILYGLLTAFLLNAQYLFRWQWAGKLLQYMYSFTAFLIAVGVYLLVTLIRLYPVVMRLFT